VHHTTGAPSSPPVSTSVNTNIGRKISAWRASPDQRSRPSGPEREPRRTHPPVCPSNSGSGSGAGPGEDQAARTDIRAPCVWRIANGVWLRPEQWEITGRNASGEAASGGGRYLPLLPARVQGRQSMRKAGRELVKLGASDFRRPLGFPGVALPSGSAALTPPSSRSGRDRSFPWPSRSVRPSCPGSSGRPHRPDSRERSSLLSFRMSPDTQPGQNPRSSCR
jgi:hypothetical protein